MSTERESDGGLTEETDEISPVMEHTSDVPESTPCGAETDEESKQISHQDLDALILKATGGDLEAQLRAAQGLLARSNTETTEAADVTAQQAVTLLCRASRQGSEEATELLREQLQRRTGITEDNLEEVTWCINTSPLEKTARQAARGLFRAINPLSPDPTLLDKLSKHEQKLIQKALKKGESEDVFVEQIMRRLHGSGGVTLDSLLQSNVEMEAFNSASLFTKMRRYPGKCLSVLIDRTIDSAGDRGMTWLRSCIPTNQIYMVLAFFIYSLITLDLVLWFVSIALFTSGVLAMAISTMQMFYTRRKRKDVSTMAKLLSRFNEALENESAESAYDWEKMTPYVTYFCALVVMIASFALSDNTWVPCSELFWLSLVFCGTCFYALSDSYDHLLLLSIGLDFVASLTVFIHALPEIPFVKPLLVLVAGNAHSITIYPGLCINLGLPSVAYLVVPVLFIKMAVEKSWQGWYRVLIPHLVCFSWWKVSVLFFRATTWFGLIRASVGWISFMCLFPIAIMGFIIWSIIYGIKFLTFGNILKVIVTLALMALPIALTFWAKGGLEMKTVKELGKNPWVKRVGFVFIFVIAFSAMFLRTPIEKDVEGRFITWEQYRELCSQPQWERTNIADAQLKCSHLKHSVVEWQGNIKKILVKETQNQAEDFLSYFPLSVSDWIKCAYGEQYQQCDTITDENDRILCELATLQGHHTCHIKNLDIYTFEVWLQMPLDGGEVHDVRVEASNWFKSELMKLSTGDTITVRAALKANLGNTWPELKLYHVSCDVKGVDYGSKSTLSETSWRVLEQVRRGAFTTWNFFMAPLVQFNI